MPVGVVMNHGGFIAAFVAVLSLAGCAGPVRHVADGKQPQRTVYPLNQSQADEVVLRSMMTAFPDVSVERTALSGGFIRYQARMDVALDSHVIVETATPTHGVDRSGQVVPGYLFDVSDHGSLIIRGPARAEAATREISTRLTALGQPIEPVPGR